MDKLTIPSNLINATLQYLATKPYAEVAPIIEAFKKCITDADKVETVVA